MPSLKRNMNKKSSEEEIKRQSQAYIDSVFLTHMVKRTSR